MQVLLQWSYAEGLNTYKGVAKSGTEAEKIYAGPSSSVPVQCNLITGEWKYSCDVALEEDDIICPVWQGQSLTLNSYLHFHSKHHQGKGITI